MSCAPPCTFVPPSSVAKPSPPVAMKLLTVMRYVLPGFCTTPPLTMTSVGPVATGGATVTSVGVYVASTIFEHAGALALHEYFRPLDDCITRLAVWPRQ